MQALVAVAQNLGKMGGLVSTDLVDAIRTRYAKLVEASGLEPEELQALVEGMAKILAPTADDAVKVE